MENPTNYFKSAAEERDENIRLRKIIRGCKLITDLLPDEEKQLQLLEEKDLIKYLILTIQFHKNSIELILNSILQIFADDLDFLTTVWLNLEFIGAIYDGAENPLDKKLKGFILKDESSKHQEVFLEKFEKALNKELHDHVHCIRKSDFNDEIQKRLVKIKSLALDYATDIFNTFVLRECPREFLESKITLFKIFLMNTFDNKIIKRVCQILEKIKLTYPGMIKNLNIYEAQIADILNKKTQADKKVLPFFDTKNAYVNILDVASPLLPSRKNLLTEYSLERKNSASPTKIRLYEARNESKQEESDDEEDKEEEEHEKEYKERLRIETLTKDMEEWLCMDKENVISNNEIMSNAFKKIEHLEIFLLFIIDPMKKILEPCWGKFYEEIAKRNVDFDYTAFKLSRPEKMDFKTIKTSNLYYLRSFKAVSCLTQRKNLKFLLSLNENSFTCLFEALKLGLMNPSYVNVNLYHIGIMLDTYLTLEANVSCNHMIKTELLLPLQANCHNPNLCEILLNLLEPFTSKYDIFGQIQVYFWTSCQEIGFFEKLTDLIIKEKIEIEGQPVENEQSDIEPILDQAEKFYSQQKTQMIKMEMVRKLGGISSFLSAGKNVDDSSNPETNLDSLLGPLKLSFDQPFKENLNIGEFQGKNPDVDYLKSFVKSLKKKKSTEIQLKECSPKGAIIKKPSFNIKQVLKEEPKVTVTSMGEADKEKLKVTVTSMAMADKFLATTSSMDMEKGFTASKLMSLYPTRFLVEHRARLDNIITNPEYQLSNLKESEKIAYPASSFLNIMISTILDYEDSVDTVHFLKIKRVEGIVAVPDMFFLKGGINFEKILMNYLLKINQLTKYNEFSNSAKECGELVNAILRRLVSPNLKTNPIIAKHKGVIIRACRLNFDYLCKLLIMLKNSKVSEIQPENYEISSLLIRVMLIESLYLMCKATVGDKNCLVNEITATLWHILVIYYFSNRNNDIYQHIFVQLLEVAVNFGTEETLFNILFKINFLGSLYNAYETFVKNEVADKRLNIDSFLFYLKKIVGFIHVINKKNEFKEVKTYLKASKNWNKLKKDFSSQISNNTQGTSLPNQNQKNLSNILSVNLGIKSDKKLDPLKEEKENSDRKEHLPAKKSILKLSTKI